MAKNKTTETSDSVTDFINSVADEVKRNDSFEIIQLMKKNTGLGPKMWGPAIVGFGAYHYKYDSGHEGNAPLIGFSPRANAITLYMEPEFPDREELLQKLGKHKFGKACVYVKRLTDIDKSILEKLIVSSFEYSKNKWGAG